MEPGLYPTGQVNPVALTVIFQQHQPPHRALLPALRSLTTRSRDFTGLALHPRLLITPNLRTLCVKVKFPDEHSEDKIPWDNLSAVVEPYVAQLQEFQIQAMDFQDPFAILHYIYEVPSSVVSLHSSFQSLLALDIRPLDLPDTAVRHLSTLPSLRHLAVTMSSSVLLEANLSDRVDCFPTLIELNVDTDELSLFATLFFRYVSSRSLETLRVTEHNQLDVWDLGPLFEILRDHESHPTLKEIGILRADHENWSQPLHVSALSSTVLASLHPLSQLTTLKINIDVSVDVADDHLKQLVAACPNLQVFRLFEQSLGNIPKVTLNGLLYLASHLPLEEITLRVDCTQIMNFSETGQILPCPHLRRLNLCTSPITDFFDNIISVFTLAFPSLSDLHFGWHFEYSLDATADLELAFTEDHYYDRWMNVSKGLAPVMVLMDQHCGPGDFT